MTNLQFMTARKFWIMLFSLACGFGMLPAHGEESGRDEARQRLENLEEALEQTSYRGVFVYARGADVNAMRIVHRYQDGTVRERLSQLDGGNGEILRHGDEVVCILPNRGRLKLNALIPAGPFAGAFSDRLRPVSSWYEPEQLEDGRIAGHDAVVVAVNAKDRHRYSYRLWLERDTGILLKSQVRDGEGQVLERFQFTQLEITDGITDAELEVPTSGRQVQRIASAKHPAQESASSDQTGSWEPGWTPDGFMAFANTADKGYRLTAYSDGIASFSVFVKPMGDINMPVGASRIGATTAYLHKISVEGLVYLVTVVGEIPPETAMRVAESVSLVGAVRD